MLISDGIATAVEPPRYSEDIDSACSTPFVSAPSSPGHGPSGYFFSAPTSPMHFTLSSQKSKTSSSDREPVFLSSDSGSFEFEFSSRYSLNASGGIGSMTSADELFFNGQIRPTKLLSHLQRPRESVGSIENLYGEDMDEVRGRDLRMRSGKYSHHRKARSMSPLHLASPYEWRASETIASNQENEAKENDQSSETTPSCSASSSRSSSSGRNSKKWIFLKDLLHRSKSEGTTNTKERFWSAISFSPAKDKKKSSPVPVLSPSSSRDETKGKTEMKKGKNIAASGKPANGAVWRRRQRSAHELHYTANRAQAEEMKKKTFLPYREGLLGCLGFSSKSYGAFSGFTRNLNPISSR